MLFSSSDNTTTALLAHSLVPSTPTYPLYHFHRDAIFPPVSDAITSLAVPVIVYWLVSLFFVLLDYLQLPSIERHRIHEPEEITKRNKVTPSQVVKAVLFQQAIQTILGILYLEEAVPPGTIANTDHRTPMLQCAHIVIHLSNLLLIPQHSKWFLLHYGSTATKFLYWYIIPFLQFLWASFIMDTWQYFWHRFFHINQFCYRHIHSIHHRLYVPYAFGALYNHPLEGFVLDSLGAVVSHWLSGMTTRQAIVLFGISTAKTVDDHCGLALPYDPFQFLFGNNADYHDIHHQQFGIKRNFSQPYFIHWDVLLSTRMTREEANRRSTHTDSRDPATVKKGDGIKGD